MNWRDAVDPQVFRVPYDELKHFFWLSFCDPDRPEGSRFLGVSIVKANSFDEALGWASFLKCNPGGEVAGTTLDGPPVPVTYLGRLLSKADLAELEMVMENAKARKASRVRTYSH